MIKTCIRSIIRNSVGGPFGPPDRRWVYTLSGVDDFIQLPAIPLEIGDTVEFDMVTGPSTGLNREIIGPNPGYIQVTDTGLWNIFGFTLTVDGITKETNDLAPIDGAVHKIVATSTGSQSLTYVGCSGGTSLFSTESIRNLKVGPNSFYPLDDGWSGNPVLLDTLGGQHGVAVNFQEDGWEKQ